jgi:soluble lytic murein transglycosylase-like protein
MAGSLIFSNPEPIKEEKLEIIAIKYEDPVKDHAYWQVVKKWGEEEWHAFDSIVRKESNWNPKAQNPKSTAFGLMQFLQATWSGVGCEKTEDPYVQIDCGIKYIELRYGNPRKALAFHNLNNWY